MITGRGRAPGQGAAQEGHGGHPAGAVYLIIYIYIYIHTHLTTTTTNNNNNNNLDTFDSHNFESTIIISIIYDCFYWLLVIKQSHITISINRQVIAMYYYGL